MTSLRPLRDLSLEELTQRLQSFASVPPYPFTAPPSDPEFDRRVKQLAKVARESPEMLYLTSVRYNTYKDSAGDEWLWAAGGGEVGRRLGSTPTDEKERLERHVNFSRGLPRNEDEYLAWRQSAPQIISVSCPTMLNKRRKTSNFKPLSSPPHPNGATLAVHHVPHSSLTPLPSLVGSALSGQNGVERPGLATSPPPSLPLSSMSNANIGSQEPTPPSSSDRTKQTLRNAKKLASMTKEKCMRDGRSDSQPAVISDQRLLTFKRIKRRSLSSANRAHSTDKKPAQQLEKEKVEENTLADVVEGTKENEATGKTLSAEREPEEKAESNLQKDMGPKEDKPRVLKKREWENLLDQSAFDLFYPPSFPSNLSCSTPNSKRSAPPSILPDSIHQPDVVTSLPIDPELQQTTLPATLLTSKASPLLPILRRINNSPPKKTMTPMSAVSLKRRGLTRLSTRSSSSSSSANILNPSVQGTASGVERTMSDIEFDGSQSFLFGFGGSQIERQIEGLTGFLRDELDE